MEFQNFINILAMICLIAIMIAKVAMVGNPPAHTHLDTVSWNG